MVTSSNNTQLIERYIDGKLPPADKLLFEARLLLSLALRKDVYFQRKIYLLVKMYHRKRLKEKLNEVHERIFNDPEKIIFQQSIYRIFNK